VGLVGNARYMEAADFALGWVGIDIAGDDGSKLGLSPLELDTPFAWARGEREPPYTYCRRCGGRLYSAAMQRGPGGWSPVKSVRGLLVSCQPEGVCRCARVRERIEARRRRDGLSPAPALPPLADVPAACPEAASGQCRAASLAAHGQQVASAAATVGRFAWGVGRAALRVVGTVPRLVRAVLPASQDSASSSSRAAGR